DDDLPKVELLADDDFEATVFEEAPRPPQTDTALNRLGESALETVHTSSDSINALPPTADDTMERAPVAPGPRDNESAPWTVSALAPAPAPAGSEDWVVTNIAKAVRASSEIGPEEPTRHDEGTPIEGTPARTPTPSPV